MKKILAFLLCFLLCFLPSLASAQIIPSLPYNLTNGTIADANQVMADFNAIVAGVNTNAANAGANTNITALNGLTTPLSPSLGGSSVYTGGSSAGTLNAQTLLNPVPLGFSLVSGRRVTFVAGFTNSGATTLNVNSTGAVAVLKQSPSGLIPLTGGEIVLNQGVDVWYDGTQYQLFNAAPQGTVQACTVIDYAGVTAPSGYLAADGTAYSRVAQANLYACLVRSGVAANTTSGSGAIVLSSPTTLQVGWYVGGANVTCNSQITVVTDSTHVTIGVNAGTTGATTLTFGPNPQGDCSTTFNVPNYSGRATVMYDASGGTVLTSTTCTNPNTLGTICGAQSQTLIAAQIPTINSQNTGTIALTVTSSSSNILQGSPQSTATTGGAITGTSQGSITSTGTIGIGSAAVVSTNTGGLPHALIQPIALVTKAIKN